MKEEKEKKKCLTSEELEKMTANEIAEHCDSLVIIADFSGEINFYGKGRRRPMIGPLVSFLFDILYDLKEKDKNLNFLELLATRLEDKTEEPKKPEATQ